MFGYTMKTKYTNLANFYFFFPSLLAAENLPNHLFFKILILKMGYHLFTYYVFFFLQMRS
jgi:hypothetical protein